MKNFAITLDNGTTHWISPHVVVAGFIFAEVDNITYILANKRGKGLPNCVGMWNAPCGYLEFGESTREGCCREIYEETGVYVNPILLDRFDIDESYTSDNHVITFRYTHFNQYDKLPNVTAHFSENDEIDDIRWIPLNEVELYVWAFNHDRIIKRINE